MRFKINDYVKVRKGFVPEEIGQPVDWHGKIVELPGESGDCYRIMFDAQSLNSLPDEYLESCIEEGYDETSYYLPDEDLEPAARRDTDKMYQEAFERVVNRMEDLDPDPDGPYSEPRMHQEVLDEWVEAFQDSPEFQQFPDKLKSLVADIPEAFARYAFDYEKVQVGEWVESDVKAVCLKWIPRKITAETEFFKFFGTGLSAFFAFLEREKQMEGAGRLSKVAAKIAPEILKRAADPSNWGMAKSFSMGAQAAGYNPADEDEMNAFLQAYNASMISTLSKELTGGNPDQPDPFRNYTGSSLVKVKYPDGSVVKCKFSKVERDLRQGKCVIVKKK